MGEAFHTDKSSITIALIGGGIGGVCAAISLGRAGYDVHLFEKAPKFSEIGAGVGFGSNAVAALHLIGKDVGDAYERIADMSELNATWFHFRNWADGTIITEIKTPRRTAAHRARLLDALLEKVPANVTPHFSADVTNVENVPETGEKPAHVRVTVQYPNSDGPETFLAAIAIGCDGVKSKVRECFPNEIKGRIRFSGSYAYRGLINMEQAVASVGDWCRGPTNWCGPDKHIIIFPIEGGTIANMVAFVTDRSRDVDSRQWEGPWVKPVSHERMYADFAGWDPRVIGFMRLVQKPEQWALHDLTPLNRWTVDRVTLLGDSAHASMPHNGAGAGQAVEDAYVIGALLSHPACNERTLPLFLEAYEGVRRPRATQQVTHCRDSGDIYEYASDMCDNYEKLASHLQSRYDWIWNHDLEADVAVALQRMRDAGHIA